MSNINDCVYNVLVSGAAGDIGISIGRILISEGISNVIGCDVLLDHAGECIFHQFNQVPKANDPEYIKEIINLFKINKVDLFIPTSEAEILLISRMELINRSIDGVPVLILDNDIVEVSLNKLKTVQYLKGFNIRVPWTVESEKHQPVDFPCIQKPVSGQGSKDVKLFVIGDYTGLMDMPGLIWQEQLLPDDQEYTCCVFRVEPEISRVIVFKRSLAGGLTGKGEVVVNNDISEYVNAVANSFNLIGSFNVQLRLTNSGPILFEINPRFSSTVMFRHKLGYLDLVWSIELCFGLPLSEYTPPTEGTKFYRGAYEYFK